MSTESAHPWNPSRPAAPGRYPGCVISVWSARGGSGKTLLATSVALAEQERALRRVVLVDLSVPFGGSEVFLDLQPEKGLRDLLPVLDELEPAQLERALTVHASGLPVLAAVDGDDGLLPDQVRRLLRFCRSLYELVVVDLPAGLSPPVLAALRESTAILYAVTPDLPAVQGLRRAIRRVSRDCPELLSRMGLVVNRVARGAQFRSEEVEGLAGVPVLGHVRSGFWHVQDCLAQSRLPVSGGRRASALGQDILRVVARVVG